MKKKGFTLIELIAVIVILAIITLIAVPIISKVVDKARKGAAEASALNYIDAVEKYVILHDLDSTKYPYDLKNNTFNVSSNTEISFLDIIIPRAKAEGTIPSLNSFITVKGDKPKSGTITLNEKGKVTEAELGFGKFFVECTGDNCIAEKQRTTLSIEANSTLQLGVGDTTELVTHTNSDKTITWSSSDDTIATVNNGVVTGVKAGNVTITAKIDKATASVNINVIDINLTISGDATRNLFINETLTLEATTNYDKPIIWTSSDDTIATVNNGVVTGLKVGSVTITAKQASTSKTVNVNVMKPGPTFVAAKSGETHKGIIYLNPKNFNATCNQSNSVSTTGTKEGCMKWYVINNSGNNYKLLLDHNTTAYTKWSSSNHYTNMDDLSATLASDTTGWYGNPKVPSWDEIAAAAGTPVNTSSGNDSTFALDYVVYWVDYSSQDDTQKARQRSYAWLFDRTYNCTSHGCNIADNSTYGYWTTTTYPNGNNAYAVNYGGGVRRSSLNNYPPTTPFYGVRPVIEVPKNIF